MFLKEFKIKGKNALKTSERKNLHHTILKQYPNLTQEQLREFMPLNDTLFKLRIATCKGVQLYVYTVDQKPTFFKLDYDEHLYPTIFTLWTWSALLPTYTIFETVWCKLTNGADLMCPGVCPRFTETTTENIWGNLPKGCLVSINSSENEAIRAVGVTALSSEDMQKSGGRGKCVKILHLYCDFLWQLYPVKIPELGIPTWIFDVPTDDCRSVNGHRSESRSAEASENMPSLTVTFRRKRKRHSRKRRSLTDSNSTENVVRNRIAERVPDPALHRAEAVLPKEYLRQNDSSSSSSCDESDDSSSSENESVSDSDDVAQESADGTDYDSYSSKENEVTPQESSSEIMDARLKYSLCKVIKFSKKTIQLPILVSTFYRNYMRPALPEEYKFDLKQSSYKKLNNFLREMENIGLLTVEETKSVQSIKKFNFEHPEIINFQLWRNDTGILNNQADAVNASTSNEIETPKISEFYSVTMPVLKLFNQAGYSRGDLVSVKDIRKHVTQYVKDNKLAKRDKITPDDYLSTIVQTKDTVSWQDLFNGVAAKMTAYHGTEEKVHKGKMRPIHMIVQTRSGNKKVTIVDNLMMYDINVQDFAKQCQHAVGASASVQTISGKKGQLLVQGNQILYIYKVLTEKYKISKNMIQGLQHAPKNKKK